MLKFSFALLALVLSAAALGDLLESPNLLEVVTTATSVSTGQTFQLSVVAHIGGSGAFTLSLPKVPGAVVETVASNPPLACFYQGGFACVGSLQAGEVLRVYVTYRAEPLERQVEQGAVLDMAAVLDVEGIQTTAVRSVALSTPRRDLFIPVVLEE